MADQSAFANGSATGVGKLSAGSTTVTSLIVAQGKAAFVKESDEATLSETTLGRFVAGQPLIAGKALPAGTTIEAREGDRLILSAPANETTERGVASLGPLPFAVGQTITAPGIPYGTTIEAAETGKLTLSAAASVTKSGAPLEAFSPCTEAARACTVAVSEEAEAAEEAEGSQFQLAATDGSRVLFTTDGVLYEWRASDESTHRIAGGVEAEWALLGASEDATRIYFASREALGGANPEGAEAVAGEANLYFREAGGEPRFVATLAAADTGYTGSPIAFEPRRHLARVSPDGEAAVFPSAAPLSGYDNADQATGEADAELFLYDAAGNGGAGKLLCASCNPAGARPRVNGSQKLPIAARIPAFENNLYAPRVLSSNGRRLFFESYDALLPGDTNGRGDVYEWEAPGEGGCTESSADYSPQDQGCIYLISSGQSKRDSEFLDASPSGSDVFFATLSSLVPSDYGLVDVYDARAGGGLPAPEPPPASCEGEACQPAAQSTGFPTAASAAFQGPGNVKEQGAAGASRCQAPARTARRLSRRAKRLRSAASSAARHNPRRARALRRKAARFAKAARRRSHRARRCRARVRKAGRAHR